MVHVSPSMRGIEEKGQSPADNRGLMLLLYFIYLESLCQES